MYTLINSVNITHDKPQPAIFNMHVQAALGITSAYALFFSFQTMHLASATEDAVDKTEYTEEFVHEQASWNMMFWGYVFACHLLTFTIVLQVCDLYLLLLATIVVQYCLYYACYPKPANLNITQENMYLLGYVCGMFLVFHNSLSPNLLVWVLLLDYFLGIGHTWERMPTTDTVINSRLFYICCQSMLLCVYYLMF